MRSFGAQAPIINKLQVANGKWQVSELRCIYKLIFGGAKPILLAACGREGDHSCIDLLFLIYLPRVINWFIKLSSSGMVEGTLVSLAKHLECVSIYRLSICSSHDKLDILLRNSIYKSKDLFDIFCWSKMSIVPSTTPIKLYCKRWFMSRITVNLTRKLF